MWGKNGRIKFMKLYFSGKIGFLETLRRGKLNRSGDNLLIKGKYLHLTLNIIFSFKILCFYFKSIKKSVINQNELQILKLNYASLFIKSMKLNVVLHKFSI